MSWSFANLLRSGAVVAGLCAATAAAHAATLIELSSPAYWGSKGDHADLVLTYSIDATKPLTVIGFYLYGVGGSAVPQVLQSCGTAQPDGTQQIQPGGMCWVRGYHSGTSIAARVVIADANPTTANLANFTRTSVELRDNTDTTLQRIEVR